MTQVIVDAGLCFAEILWFADALKIKELGQRLQVGKASRNTLGADSCEAVRQVETAGEDIQRDLKARHSDDCVLRDWQKAVKSMYSMKRELGSVVVELDWRGSGRSVRKLSALDRNAQGVKDVDGKSIHSTRL